MQCETHIMDSFKDSLERCQADPHFLTLFYKKFILSNSEVREKFANTDMQQQKMMLHASIYMIMLSAQSNGAASVYMEKIAKRHARSDLDINPDLYRLWLETLIETIRETDTQFNDTIETAWRTVMGYGIDYMVSHYDDA